MTRERHDLSKGCFPRIARTVSQPNFRMATNGVAILRARGGRPKAMKIGRVTVGLTRPTRGSRQFASPLKDHGADGGGRTRTASRPKDFKSFASTGFATSA